MTKEEFEAWVGEFLKRRFSGSTDAWRDDVLRRYYLFGKAFDLQLTQYDLYSRVHFALWFIGGQK